uniref:WD repeat domain 54 n=1 Tax=Amazona collaria TaxID=241587 RepID=A0A8B9FW10_9PSIT
MSSGIVCSSPSGHSMTEPGCPRPPQRSPNTPLGTSFQWGIVPTGKGFPLVSGWNPPRSNLCPSPLGFPMGLPVQREAPSPLYPPPAPGAWDKVPLSLLFAAGQSQLPQPFLTHCLALGSPLWPFPGPLRPIHIPVCSRDHTDSGDPPRSRAHPRSVPLQMYEADGSVLVYWHALDVAEHPPAQAVFARGIAAVGERFICVGTSSGPVLVFDIPPKGTNVTVSEVLEQHGAAVTDIAAEQGRAPDGAGDLVSADDAGTLCVWSAGEEFRLVSKVPACGCTCSSVALWHGTVAAGFGNGQIRLYEAASGRLRAQVNAHARWINALDLAPETGKLLSGAEDSFVHIWKLSRNPDTDDVEVSWVRRSCPKPPTRVLGAPPEREQQLGKGILPLCCALGGPESSSGAKGAMGNLERAWDKGWRDGIRGNGFQLR